MALLSGNLLLLQHLPSFLIFLHRILQNSCRLFVWLFAFVCVRVCFLTIFNYLVLLCSRTRYTTTSTSHAFSR